MQQKPQKKPLMIVSFQLDTKAELEIKIFSAKTFKKDIFDFIQNQNGINKRVKQKVFQRILKFAAIHMKIPKTASVKSFKSINEYKKKMNTQPSIQRVQTCTNLGFKKRYTQQTSDLDFTRKSQPRSSLLSLRNQSKPLPLKKFQTLKCNTMKRANTYQNKLTQISSGNISSLNNLNNSTGQIGIEDLSSVLTSDDQNLEQSMSKQTLKNKYDQITQSRPGTKRLIEQRAIKTSKQKIFSKLKPIKVKPIRQKKITTKVQNDITFRNNVNKVHNIILKNHDVQLQTKLIHLHKTFPQLFQELEILFMKLDTKNLTYINQKNLDLRNLNQKELKIVESIFLDIFSMKQNEKMYIENFMDAFIKKNNIQL